MQRKTGQKHKINPAAKKRQNMVALDKQTATLPLGKRPATIGDVRNLQEMLGINLKDFYYLTAYTAREIPMSPQYSNVRLDSIGKRIQLALLTRFLTLCLEANPLMPEPDMEEILPVIQRILKKEVPDLVQDDTVSWGKVSMCFGTTDWSGHNWSLGAARSPMVQRLFLSLAKAIEVCGEEKTAEIYRQALNEEARARGFRDLRHVIRMKSWHTAPAFDVVKEPEAVVAKPVRARKKKAETKKRA